MKDEKVLVNFRMREADAEELKRVSEQIEIPQSQIIREAVKEKIASLKQERSIEAPATA